MPVPRGFPQGQSRLHRESATKICVCVFVYVAPFFFAYFSFSFF